MLRHAHRAPSLVGRTGHGVTVAESVRSAEADTTGAIRVKLTQLM